MKTVAEFDINRWKELFRRQTPSELPPDWENNAAIIGAHQALAREYLNRLPDFPAEMEGRGIVICAGGHRLFTNAWVCLRMLRSLGCTLPVQFWHLGGSEMDDRMRALVADYGVTCVDAENVSQYFPVRRLFGWELKPFAILHCPFREVILLDADNVPLIDPEFLFETKEYQDHGAIFWPDFGRLEDFRNIWRVCEVEYRDEPEFESGQIVVDKQRCWEALNLTMHYNEHSDFYYLHIHGDKETFHLAFHHVGKSYAMPDRGIDALHCTMCQHDFDGRRIFQHRNMDKWRYDGSNAPIAGFENEDQCWNFLDDLRQNWNGRVLWNDSPETGERRAIKALSGQQFEYERVGYDQRTIELLSDRTVGQGRARMESEWTVIREGWRLSVVIFGESQPTCRLVPQQGEWHGYWFRHERMPVVLRRIT